jgi:hypothetical protein
VRTIRGKRQFWTDELTVMERDLRITGSFRGQSDAVAAPTGFEGMSPREHVTFHRDTDNMKLEAGGRSVTKWPI